MTKYIFHGGAAQIESANNDRFYTELMKDAPQHANVLIVYFASRTDDITPKIAYDTEKCQKLSFGKMPIVNAATTDNFLEQINTSDVIYFRGGSTKKLIEILKKYPDLKPLFENKTVAGSSAGAYALSTFYPSHYEKHVEEGLGIVSVRVVTHFQSETMSPNQDAIETLKNSHTDLELIVLKEGEYKVVMQ